MMKKILNAVFSKKFKSLSVVVAVVIVFVTTYALILPAVTLETDAVREEDGIVIQQDQDDAEVVETAYQEDTISETGGESEYYASEEASVDGTQEAVSGANEQTVPGDDISGQDSSGVEQTDDNIAGGSGSVEAEIVIVDETGYSEQEIVPDEIFYPAMTFETEITMKGEISSVEALSEQELLEKENAEALTPQEEAAKKKEIILKVKAEAEEGALPEGTTMRVEEVASDDIVGEIVKGAAEDATGGKMQKFQAVDITFVDKEGVEIEPAKQIKITITSDTIKEEQNAEGQEQTLIHINNDGTAEVIDKIEEWKLETAPADDEVIFEADKFSVYAVAYTVDFYWEVNGKMYRFSIPGGGYVSFSELVEVLGIAKTQGLDGEAGDSAAGAGGDDNASGNAVEYEDAGDGLTLGEIEVSEESRKFVEGVENISFSTPEYLWVGKVESDMTVQEYKRDNDLEVQYSGKLTGDEILQVDLSALRAGDWALISLCPFTSEEVLTVTMKDGEVFTIKVTDAVEDAIMNGDVVQTVVNPSGTTIDLFDYWILDSLRNSNARAGWPYNGNWYNYNISNGTYGTQVYEYPSGNLQLYGQGSKSGINANGTTNGHALKFTPAQAGAVIDGTLNVRSIDSANKENPTGGLNSWTRGATPRTGIVTDTLDGGYPKLTTDGSIGTNGESLAYLFDDNAHAGKQKYSNVNQLLYVDPNGYYTYNSHDFDAQFNASSRTFTLRQQTAAVGDDRGFWPFGTTHYWLGMHMHTQFSMPEDGKVLSPVGKYNDMIFEFQGDDDTWLYVDGVLVGDGGGIHNQTLIRINFRDGTVLVSGKYDAKDDYKTNYEVTYYLDELFTTAGRYDDYEWVDSPTVDGHKTFVPGTYHTFDMFYLERGGGESNLKIKYNLVSTADFTAHKSYYSDDDTRMQRDQYKFELVGLDGRFESVPYDDGGVTKYRLEQTDWTDGTYTVSGNNAAIMPISENASAGGAGTVASPQYYTGPDTLGDGTAVNAQHYLTGVTEDGNVNFGSALISDTEKYAYEDGHPSVYRYKVREIVPDDAVNAEGRTWLQASDAEKAEGGFIKDGITYDGRIFYMTASVTSWSETGADGETYTVYGLDKRYFTDDTYEEQISGMPFISFLNGPIEPLDLKIIKKGDGDGTLLSGAKFTLTRAMKNDEKRWVPMQWENDAHVTETTDPVERTTVQGVLTFEDLTEGHYILEETEAPAGYEIGDVSRWLVTISKEGGEEEILLVPTIQELTEDGTLTGAAEDIELAQPHLAEREILNTPKTIQLTLNKEWLGGAPEDEDVTFVLKRYKSYEKPGGSLDGTLNVYRVPTNSSNEYDYGGKELLTTRTFAGDTSAQVRFTYDYWMGADWKNGSYRLNDDPALLYGTGYSTGNDSTGFYANIPIPVGGVVDMYIGDGNMNGQWWQHQVRLGGDPTGTPATGTVTDPENITQEDTSFSVPYTFPAGTVDWTHAFGAYPVVGTNAEYNVPETYTYYIEEDPEISGYDVVYDRMDGTDIAGSDESEMRTITNVRRMDVPVQKTWEFSEDDEDRAASWDVTFVLEFREVLVSGEPDPAVQQQHRWLPVPGVEPLTIHNGDSIDVTRFSDLPLYRVHTVGSGESLYRYIYAVDEIAYHVYDSDDNLIAAWTKDNSEPQVGTLYAPDYEQDAGELDQPDDPAEWDSWYTICLTNSVSETTVMNTIDLDIQKVWEGDEEGAISDDDVAYAKFQLMRYVHEEYRDYSKEGIDPDTPVTVTLVLDNDHQTELTVPKGAPVYVDALVKSGANADLTFRKPDNSTFALQLDNSGSDAFASASTPEFRPDSDCTITFVSGDLTAVSGGPDGIRLACYTDRQDQVFTEEYIDAQFENEPAGQVFTLRKSDHWQKDWWELPQVVEGKLNGNLQTVYVYTYFLEEKGHSPGNFSAVFTDSSRSGELLGDDKTPIDFTSSITATNTERTEATIIKVWDDDDDADGKRPQTLTVMLMADGGSTGRTVTLSDENDWTATLEDLPKYNDSEEIDYYWSEQNIPDGYFLTGNSREGNVITLTNSLSTYDLWTDYSGTKTWDDRDDLYKTRPHELAVKLYWSKALTDGNGDVVTDGEGDIVYGDPQIAPYTVGWDTTVTPWVYTFEHIPVFDDNGNVIKYSVEESVPGSYNMTEEATPTTYTLGEIWTDDGKKHVVNRETESILEWDLESMIDLPFVIVKGTNAQPAYVWTPRVPTPAERDAIWDELRGLNNGWHVVNPVEDTNWYVSNAVIENPGHGSVIVEYDPENKYAKLRFTEHDVWAQFMIGGFELPPGGKEYDVGETDFENSLETTSLQGTKTWMLEDGTIPENPPVLTLTRTAEYEDGEGQTVTTPAETVVIRDSNDPLLTVPLMPVWDGTGTTRTFTYAELPKYDLQGREYIYEVAEVSFTVGTGADAVTYTVQKGAGGIYTVTSDPPDAPPVSVRQTGNDIVNGMVEADVEIIKVEKGHRDSEHTLSGATFQLTRVNEDDDYNMTGSGAYQSEIQTVDPDTGITVFEGLQPGRYKLEEKNAPVGYILRDGPWFIRVDTSGNASLEVSYELVTPSGVANSFYVENEPGAALPDTGGPGTKLLTALGITLIGLAGAWLLMRKRKKAA